MLDCVLWLTDRFFVFWVSFLILYSHAIYLLTLIPSSALMNSSCLDDEELSYLGAPFEEYETNAKLVGLDVIRFVYSLHVYILRFTFLVG